MEWSQCHFKQLSFTMGFLDYLIIFLWIGQSIYETSRYCGIILNGLHFNLELPITGFSFSLEIHKNIEQRCMKPVYPSKLTWMEYPPWKRIIDMMSNTTSNLCFQQRRNVLFRSAELTWMYNAVMSWFFHDRVTRFNITEYN